MKNLFSNLRAEAENVSEANKLMLLNKKTHDVWEMADRYSGRATQKKLEIGGAALSCGSFVGFMSIAAANQAAALGTSTLLATASTALAGLGTVAVGSAVLPVATVATLGAAIVGLGIAAASKLIRVDHSKGSAMAKAIASQDKVGLQLMGKDDVGVADWIKGAKNYFVRSINETLFVQEGRDPPAQNRRDAALDYEVAELFADSVEDATRSKQAVVDSVSAEIWEKHGVVVSDERIHACLGKTRESGVSVGKILAVDADRGLVLQSLGRGQAIVHNLSDFEVIPQVGKEMTLSSRSGRIQAAPDQRVGRTSGLSL